jgi:hypothetical protein
MSVPSLLVDHLESHGLPLHYASKVTGMFTGNADILFLGLRLAFIGLCAGLIREFFNHWRHAIYNGEPLLLDTTMTDPLVLFPTTHLGGMARVWVGSYLAHDADVQRQLKHCRILADADSPNELIKKKSQGYIPLQGTWSEDGVNATVLPNDCKSV